MDKLAQLDAKADKLEQSLSEATDAHGIHSEMMSLKRIVKPTTCKVTRLCNEYGEPSASLRDEKLVFRSYFSVQLGGEPSSFSCLTDACRNSLADESCRCPTHKLFWKSYLA